MSQTVAMIVVAALDFFVVAALVAVCYLPHHIDHKRAPATHIHDPVRDFDSVPVLSLD
jgi:hypothetical protein